MESSIAFRHTCQGYSPSSVARPPTILALLPLLGTPHAKEDRVVYSRALGSSYLQQEPGLLAGFTETPGGDMPGQELLSQCSHWFWPEMWIPLLSTLVLHQGLGSPSRVVQVR